ncbi:MAG: TetR/AcrR family transcriptional regulator [Ktedonobacteraceae bacterium]
MKHGTNPLPLRERNRLRVTQRILSAAFELFRATGYDQTTMDAIAEKAEVSRGTLFNYFPTKAALLMPFIKELYFQQVRPEVMPYLETQPTTQQALRFLFMSIYEHIFKFPAMTHALQAMQQEVLHPHPQAMDFNQGTGFLDNIQSILQYGQQRGEVRTDLHLEKLVRYVAVLYVSLISDIFDRYSPDNYINEVDILLAFITNALHQ